MYLNLMILQGHLSHVPRCLMLDTSDCMGGEHHKRIGNEIYIQQLAKAILS